MKLVLTNELRFPEHFEAMAAIDEFPLAQAPSPFVRRCIERIGDSSIERDAIDVPCGFGRHSILAAAYGYRVLAVDLDSSRLQYLQEAASALPQFPKIEVAKADLHHLDSLKRTFDLALITDFVSITMLENAHRLLNSSGYLIYESFGGVGGNWHSLPLAGEVRRVLGEHFDILTYRERRVPAATREAVTVKTLVRAK